MQCKVVFPARFADAMRSMIAPPLHSDWPDLDQAAIADECLIEPRSLRAAHDALQRQIDDLATACDAFALERRGPSARPAQRGHISTDANAIILDSDHAAGALLKRDQGDLVGKPLATIIAAPDRRSFGRHVCELIENPRSGEWQTRIIPNGSIITISVALSIRVVTDAAGALCGMQWTIRDLRELRRVQSETMAREELLRGRAAQRDSGKRALSMGSDQRHGPSRTNLGRSGTPN